MFSLLTVYNYFYYVSLGLTSKTYGEKKEVVLFV